jgi:S1-C subfamily serine protease
VDADDGLEEDEPLFPWLPPDDRLWRHPSEVASGETLTRTLPIRDAEHRLWTVALLAGALGALLASGFGVVAGQYHRTTTVVRPIEQIIDPAAPYVTIAANPANPKDDIGDIAAHLRPSLVGLLVSSNGASGTGTGVIFRSDGYILTNSHVVDGAQSIMALLSDGHRFVCQIVGSDPSTDIAVVKLKGSKSQVVATLGSSSQLRVGQTAIAIGSSRAMTGVPLVTSGIISAVDLQVSAANGPHFVDMIQTDAAIEPGSSGGALVDASGTVIGITNASDFDDTGRQALGYATPIEVARDVADQLLNTGKVTHAWLGVEGADIDVMTAKNLGLPGGAMVSNVDSHSPAERAGVTATDIVTAFDGNPVNSMSTLEMDLRHHRPGDRISLTFIHDGGIRATEVVLMDRPAADYP